MSERVDAALIARYLSGECSAAEIALVDRWMEEDAERRSVVGALRGVWESKTARAVPEFDADRALWRRIATDMTRRAKPHLVPDAPAQSPVRLRRVVPFDSLVAGSARGAWWGIAAAAIAAAGLLLMDESRDAVREARELAGQTPALQMREVATERAHHADVYLSDGTHAVLDQKVGCDSRRRLAIVAMCS